MTEVELSEIGLGTMRFDFDSAGAGAKWLCRLHECGITTHHVSTEYESYGTYRQALTSVSARSLDLEHIIKLSEPGFDSNTFSCDSVIDVIDRALLELGIDRLDVIQWLVRTPDASDSATKLNLLSEQRHLIDECFADLTRAGKIGTVAFFPYVADVWPSALSLNSVTGLCGYLNLLETDLADAAMDEVPVIALRPLAAGLLQAQPTTDFPPPLTHASLRVPTLMERLGTDPSMLTQQALRYPLLSETVACVVLSIKHDRHLNAAVAALAGIRPDRQDFVNTTRVLQEF